MSSEHGSPTLAGIPQIPQVSTSGELPEAPTPAGIPQIPRSPHEKTLNLRLCFELEAVAEAYEERAAILEFDAGMSRQDAEHLARRLTGYEGA